MNKCNIPLACTGMLACLSHQSFAAPTTTPNIVIIFLDDMGYGDLGVTGAKGYKTPNLDRLAHEGVLCTQFYVAQAVSSASRTGLLTGCYPNRIGITGALNPFATTGISDQEMTMAELLKQRNYTCGIFGKWHLGHHRQFLPLQHGFDEYLGLPYSNDMLPMGYDGTVFSPDNAATNSKASMPPLPLIEGNEKIKELRTLEDQEQLTTLYTERAVSFIRKNKNKPFFLYLPHSMPHTPLAVSSKFKGKSEIGIYGDVMMEIDWSVGQIMATLKELKLDENTLVIFTSDNGPWLNFGDHAGSAAGMREGKGTTWEGGQRLPCIMRWKGKIKEGQICNQLISTIDLLPTIANICNAPLPPQRIDGINVWPLLSGATEISPRRYFLYYYDANNLKAVRNERFKLVFPHSYRTYEENLPGINGMPGETSQKKVTEPELYDLRRDPGERYNVIALYPDVVAELSKVAEEARDDLGDALTSREGRGRRPAGRLVSE